MYEMDISEFQLPKCYQKIPITFIQRILILSCITVAILTSSWYCLSEAKNLHELVEPLYSALGFSIALIVYSISLWNRDEISNLFHIIETKIQDRKLECQK